jgi:hypothetical protein
MFIAPLAFLVVISKPLDMTFCQILDSDSSSEATVATRRNIAKLEKAINNIISSIQSRGFIVQSISCDGEGGITAMIPALNKMGIEVSIAAAGAHVPQVEVKIKFIKEKHRTIVCSLPYLMPRIVKTYCVYFNVGCINNHVSSTAMDGRSPRDRFTGVSLNVRDFRFEFGQYAHATVPNTSNDMTPRTSTCICLLSAYNNTGSVRLFDLNSRGIITRDAFQLLPMPASVIEYLNAISRAEGNRGNVRFAGGPEISIDIEGHRNLPNLIVPADILPDDPIPNDNNAPPNAVINDHLGANIGGDVEGEVIQAEAEVQIQGDAIELADVVIPPAGDNLEAQGEQLCHPPQDQAHLSLIVSAVHSHTLSSIRSSKQQ